MKKVFVVIAATLSISSAFAQTAAPAASPATAASPAAGAAHREARVEQRIAYLHSALKITAAQESQWNTFADVMRANSQSMNQLIEQRQAATGEASALDNMKQYAQMAQTHSDDMQKLVTAFEPLYNSLSPEQKALADKTFREHGHPGAHKPHHRGAAKHGAAKPAEAAPAQ